MMRRLKYYCDKKYKFATYLVTYLYIQIIDVARVHQELVEEKCNRYREVCKASRQNLMDIFTTADSTCQPSPPSSMTPALSMKTVMHYSFNMAQQVKHVYIATFVICIGLGTLSIRSLQPGPVYFLTPRKCAIFGVCCEVIPRQVNVCI